MTVLYVILGILLALLILCCIPLRLDIEYDGFAKAKIKYLFFSFQLVPAKPKKNPKPEEDKKKQEKEENPILELVKQKGLPGLVALIKNLAKLLAKAGKRLMLHTVVYRMNIHAAVAGEDAAECAMQYAYVCAAVYPAVSFIKANTAKCRYNLDIAPNFEGEKTEIKCRIVMGVKPIFALYAAVPFAVGAIKTMSAGTIQRR